MTNASGCLGAATAYDTVNTFPVPTAITGTMHVCAGATSTLADASLWGAWSSANTSVATVNAATGVVTGVSAGTDIILYSVVNSCGSALDTALITVYASPTVGAISGPAMTICAGATTILSDATAGGDWSSGNTAIATVGSTTGVVTGVTAGSVVFSYTVTNTSGCSGYAIYDLTFGSDLGTSSVHPNSATLCDGHDVYMYVTTSASGVTYQWLRNGVVIPGATSNGYTTSLAGDYSVIISNGSCEETLTGTVVNNMTAPVVSFTSPNVLYTGSYSNYQWYRNGIAIPGATTGIYHETLPGDYTVVVTDNGCSDTATGYTISGGVGSGVKIISNNNSITIYPNPATTLLYIDAQQEVDARILCADGRIAIEQTSAKEINVSNLANGLYIIMLYDKDGLLVKTDKFIKRD
jgi:hypothetical protein